MTCRSSALLMSVAVLACAGGCGPAASHSETGSTNGYPAAPQERASNSSPAPGASGKADGRYWLTGGESALLSLAVWRGDVAVIPQAVSVWVTSPEHDAVNVEWRNDADTATFSPAALLAIEAATPLRVHLEFEVDGARRERAALNFNYTPAVAIPAKFTSGFEDDLVQGSLELRVGVDVFEPGHYLVDCNLYSADQPVAWARFKGLLDGGAATVTLKFFGRALFDAGRGGPYRIGELRGARYVEGQTPDLERVAPLEGTYVTRPYALSLLSNAEWDAPEKHAKIAALQRMGY